MCTSVVCSLPLPAVGTHPCSRHAPPAQSSTESPDSARLQNPRRVLLHYDEQSAAPVPSPESAWLLNDTMRGGCDTAAQPVVLSAAGGGATAHDTPDRQPSARRSNAADPAVRIQGISTTQNPGHTKVLGHAEAVQPEEVEAVDSRECAHGQESQPAGFAEGFLARSKDQPSARQIRQHNRLNSPRGVDVDTGPAGRGGCQGCVKDVDTCLCS